MRQIFCLGLVWSATLLASEPRSAYAGQEQRVIKSLSEVTIEAYESGQGMGLAKAAELNGYPGPKHVLELADELALTAAQIEQMQALYQSMLAAAMPLGQDIVRLEAELDAHFANRTINPHLLQHLTSQIGMQQGALRAVHLERHLAASKILSAEQNASYAKLRGYDKPADQAHHGHHSH